MTTITGHIIVACWFTFIIVWLFAALRTKPIVERQSAASMLAHRLPVGLGWWTMIIPKWPGPMSWQFIPRTPLFQLVGAAICIYGLAFTLWARYTLAGNWSSDVTFKKDHQLIRSGPYRIVRHPIYTGLLVMCLGTAIHLGQVRGILSLLLFGLGFWIKLSQEERLLLRHFPDDYPTYRREVKALIPFVI